MAQRFSFLALTKEGNKMSGIILAESMAQAKEKLSNSGMAVLSLEEKTEVLSQQEGITSFEFLAINSERKTVHGSIDSEDKYTAYKKLRQEYNLTVSYIIPGGLSEEKKAVEVQKGLDPELEKQWEEEQKREEKQKAKTEKTEDLQKALEAQQKEAAFIHEKIEEVIANVSDLLRKYGKYVHPDKKREIEDRIDLLSRVRHSNSLNHLKNVVQQVVQKLGEDTLFIEEAQLDAAEKEDYASGKVAFTSASSGITKNIDKGLAELQSIFAGIDEESLEAIRKNMREIDPLRKTAEFFFHLFSSIGIIAFSFWLWNGVASFLQDDVQKSAFYFHSGLLWYLTIFALVVAVPLGIGLYREDIDTPKKRLILVGSAFGVFLLVSFEFPILFFWI